MRANYNSIDVIKVCMSILVVAIHTHPEYNFAEIANELIRGVYTIAVPYFFIVSGFLVWHKIADASIEKKQERLKKWISKTIRLYMVWTAIYLPFTIYGFWHDGVSVAKSALVFVRNFLLVGENYLSWPLWYLLGMLVAGCIIFLIINRGYKNRTLYIVAFAFAICGALLNYCSSHHLLANITDVYFKLFHTTRNGFFEGLPYITIGIAIASGHIIKQKKILTALFLGSLVFHMMGIKLATFVTVYALFCIVIQFDLPNRNDSFYANCRLTSTIIYFVHMIWVGLLTLLLPIKLSPLWLFVIVVLLSFLTAIFVIRNKENRLFRFCFR